MSRIASRPRPAVEGSTGIKFSEVIVIAIVLAVAGYGVKVYLDMRRSAGAAVQEFLSYVKSGNTANQYGMLDAKDKEQYFPSRQEYEKATTLAHGYTERIENVVLGAEVKNPKDPDKVTIPTTVTIRSSGQGKELYQVGAANTYTDKFVMRRNSEGQWKVVLSQSVNPDTGKLNVQKATPSPDTSF